MRHKMETLTINLLGILLLAGAALAQEQRVNPILPSINIETEYDRFKDVTTVVLKPEHVRVTSKNREVSFVTISAVFSFPGKEHARPVESLQLAVSVYSYNWMFLNNRNPRLIALVGEKKALDVIAPRVDGKTVADIVVEVMIATLTRAELQKLINGNAVSVQVGEVEFDLTTSNLADLRDFVFKLSPMPVK
jgi:hypothetical protein